MTESRRIVWSVSVLLKVLETGSQRAAHRHPVITASTRMGVSVSLAQFILESGYGKSELAQNANNIFGMKYSLSGNT